MHLYSWTLWILLNISNISKLPIFKSKKCVIHYDNEENCLQLRTKNCPIFKKEPNKKYKTLFTITMFLKLLNKLEIPSLLWFWRGFNEKKKTTQSFCISIKRHCKLIWSICSISAAVMRHDHFVFTDYESDCFLFSFGILEKT